MKGLIIGGSGFVGAYLIRQLRREDLQVVVTKMPQETIENSDEQVRICDLNILERKDIVSLLWAEKPDYIFHLAAQSSVALSWKNPELTIDVNIKGSTNLLEALRQLDYQPRVLMIGSGEEYGHIRPEETPIKETNLVRPGNVYAATKACQNMLAKIYADAYGLDIMMVRAFNHIGPNQLPMFVVADFCKQVAEIEQGQAEAVLRVGNLSAERDFTDVRDVVRAYVLLAQYGVRGETYNIGSGKAIAIQEVLNMILEQAKVEIEVAIEKEKLRPVDVPMIAADITKLQKCTGWQPEIDLKQTIQETLDYWRKGSNRCGL